MNAIDRYLPAKFGLDESSDPRNQPILCSQPTKKRFPTFTVVCIDSRHEFALDYC